MSQHFLVKGKNKWRMYGICTLCPEAVSDKASGPVEKIGSIWHSERKRRTKQGKKQHDSEVLPPEHWAKKIPGTGIFWGFVLN
jgi:hypothetical protein